MTSRGLTLALVLLPTVAVAATLDRSTAVEQMRLAGELDAETAAIYQLWAVRQPEKLPAELRALPEPDFGCATSHFVHAFQMMQRGELSTRGVREYKQGADRPPSAGYIDSSVYNLRVHYEDGLASRAQSILDYAEDSWAYQVGTLGFRRPVGDYGGASAGGSNDLDIYVGALEYAAGVTVPEQDWAQSTHADCTVHVVISDQIRGGNLATTVAHEFNHVLQAAHDCAEWIAFWENTANYIMDLSFDSVNDYIYTLPDFQQNPYLPFDLFQSGSGYQYGASLVPMTFDEAIGNGDGVAIRRVWEASEQESFYTNEPDYFDAVDIVAPEFGGQGMDQLQGLLTEYRYLVGSRDDGAHLSEAGLWENVCGSYCEPPHDHAYGINDLPVTASARNAVYAHGSSYVRVNIGRDKTGLLKVDFNGDDITRWGVKTICAGTGPALVTPLPVSVVGLVSETVPVAVADGCTIAISNLGTPDYDPDDDFDSQSSRTYSYDFALAFVEAQLPAPTITGVTPDTVPCAGTPNLTITGTGFLPGPQVRLGGAAVPVVSATPDTIVVEPLARTESAAMSVEVVNQDGQVAAWNVGIVYEGEGCYCSCDQTFECDDECPCDLECYCLCDRTDGCEEDCDCDSDCGGCNCASTQSGATMVLGLIGLLSVLRRRR